MVNLFTNIESLDNCANGSEIDPARSRSPLRGRACPIEVDGFIWSMRPTQTAPSHAAFLAALHFRVRRSLTCHLGHLRHDTGCLALRDPNVLGAHKGTAQETTGFIDEFIHAPSPRGVGTLRDRLYNRFGLEMSARGDRDRDSLQ
jgi:hypothetical protein